MRNEEGRVRNEEFATTIMTTLYTGLTCPHADYIHTPLIEIRPVEDAAPLRRALARLASYDYLHVTSRVLIPRSNLALSIIPDGLRRLGFIVDCVTAYNTCMPANPRRIDLTTVDRIVFTSPSTVDNFLWLYGSLPADKELVARGPITAQHLRGYIARPPISPISPISQLPHEPHEPQLSH